MTGKLERPTKLESESQKNTTKSVGTLEKPIHENFVIMICRIVVSLPRYPIDEALKHKDLPVK